MLGRVAGALLTRPALPLLAALLLGACGGSETTTVTVAETATETVVVTDTETVATTTTVPVPPDLSTRAFRHSSADLGCLLAGGELRCDVLPGLDPEPDEPCGFDWVGLTLSATGPATPNCGSDTVYDRSAPALAPGATWGRGDFACAAGDTGLECTSRGGGSFLLAPGSWSAG